MASPDTNKSIRGTAVICLVSAFAASWPTTGFLSSFATYAEHRERTYGPYHDCIVLSQRQSLQHRPGASEPWEHLLNTGSGRVDHRQDYCLRQLATCGQGRGRGGQNAALVAAGCSRYSIRSHRGAHLVEVVGCNLMWCVYLGGGSLRCVWSPHACHHQPRNLEIITCRVAGMPLVEETGGQDKG